MMHLISSSFPLANQFNGMSCIEFCMELGTDCKMIIMTVLWNSQTYTLWCTWWFCSVWMCRHSLQLCVCISVLVFKKNFCVNILCMFTTLQPLLLPFWSSVCVFSNNNFLYMFVRFNNIKAWHSSAVFSGSGVKVQVYKCVVVPVHTYYVHLHYVKTLNVIEQQQWLACVLDPMRDESSTCFVCIFLSASFILAAVLTLKCAQWCELQ